MSEYFFTSRTKYPNTPETDMMDEVLHVVTYKKDDEKITVEVMATDPSNAINIVRRELK
tara:strand:- start:222 stop:398 length:177 start_codon:yes stop_codon:yes gene_type:complete